MLNSIKLAAFASCALLTSLASAEHYDYGNDAHDRVSERSAYRHTGYSNRNYDSYDGRSNGRRQYQGYGNGPSCGYQSGNQGAYDARYRNDFRGQAYAPAYRGRNGYSNDRYGYPNNNRYNTGRRRTNFGGGLLGLLSGRGRSHGGYYGH